jgi:chemotaxis protein histidine kinase CheA
MPSPTSISLEDTLAGLRNDFIVQAETKTADLEEKIGTFLMSDSSDTEELILTLMREVHNLKGGGGTFGFPILSVIAHRLEDFITDADGSVERDFFENVLLFIDKIRDSLEFTNSTSDEEIDQFLRSLPVASSASDSAPALQSDLETLIISPSKTTSAISRRFLEKNGVRVVGTRSPTEGLILAIRSRPDLVIVSMVMEELSGVDVARALNNMTPTENTPVVLITSLPDDHPDFSVLPATVTVSRQDNQFYATLSELIKKIGKGREK